MKFISLVAIAAGAATAHEVGTTAEGKRSFNSGIGSLFGGGIGGGSDVVGKLIGGTYFSASQLAGLGIDFSSIPSQFDVTASQLAGLGIDPNSFASVIGGGGIGGGIRGGVFAGLAGHNIDINSLLLGQGFDLRCELQSILGVLGFGGSGFGGFGLIESLSAAEQIQMLVLLDELSGLLSGGFLSHGSAEALLFSGIGKGGFSVGGFKRAIDSTAEKAGVALNPKLTRRSRKARGHGRRTLDCSGVSGSIGGINSNFGNNTSIAITTTETTTLATGVATPAPGGFGIITDVVVPPAAETSAAVTTTEAAVAPPAETAPAAPPALNPNDVVVGNDEG